jgi:hypothetical protein
VTDQNFASLVDLEPDSTYDVEVAAVDGGSEARSTTTTVTTEPQNPDNGGTSPGPPTDLHAEQNPDGVGPFHITVVWRRSPDTDTYRVYLDGQQRKTVTGQNFASVVQLSPETTYELQVAAVTDGEEARSDTITVTTEAEGS